MTATIASSVTWLRRKFGSSVLLDQSLDTPFVMSFDKRERLSESLDDRSAPAAPGDREQERLSLSLDLPAGQAGRGSGRGLQLHQGLPIGVAAVSHGMGGLSPRTNTCFSLQLQQGLPIGVAAVSAPSRRILFDWHRARPVRAPRPRLRADGHQKLHSSRCLGLLDARGARCTIIRGD